MASTAAAVCTLLCATSAALLTLGTPAQAAAPQAKVRWTPVISSDFPDPDVLFYDGTYYGFATQNFSASVNIQTATSPNGIDWTETATDALPALPSWAQPDEQYPYKNTWAPSVAYDAVDQEFVMYYAATDVATGDQCIGMALATQPLGPYIDNSTSPAVCQFDDGGSIDPDIFIGSGGNATLVWKNDGNHTGQATAIWAAPLAPDLQSLTAGPVAILADDQTWQAGIVEGPDMADINGVDLLFYAGNDEGTANYGIGYAICPDGPLEPCDDSSQNPILTTAPGMSGPGGPSVFTSQSGQTLLAFAAWSGTTIGYMAGGSRPMYLAALTLAGGVPTLVPANPATAASTLPGYWQVAADGGIFAFGDAKFYGSTGSLHLNKPVVGMAPTADGLGYWLVASDGGIFAFGDAGFYGSTGSLHLNAPIVGMTPTADGLGYWLVASDGGIFAFGDAKFYGSTGGYPIFYAITGMAATTNGDGYWLVDSNGDIFSYGDARNFGEPTQMPGAYRIAAIAPTTDGAGYWVAAANGSVGSFGDAVAYGSAAADHLDAPIVGMATTDDGGGYWLQGADGGIFSFGDAVFEGSMGGRHLNAPMVGIAAD